MAISPSIPTSFVPRQQSPEQPKRPYSRANNIFTVVAFGILGVAVAACVATYLYDKYLTHSLDAKSQLLATAQSSVDKGQIQNFIRLRDRLSASQGLLDNHITLTNFFNTLEKVTLQNVTFTNLNLTVAPGDHTATLSVDGIAKSFNSLAVQSNAFSTQKGIKQAIFSGIAFSKDPAGITFHLSAVLDPTLVTGGALLPPTQGGTVTVPVATASSSVNAQPVPTASTTSPIGPSSTTSLPRLPVAPRHP